MSIYRLPHGQFGYSGQILNVPQNVNSFVNELPRCPATLDVVIVRREGADETHTQGFTVANCKQHVL